MSLRKELLEIPNSLRQMYKEGRPLYDAVIRSVSWGERPVFMLGSGSAYLAALSGAWAFESMTGMPVVARSPAVFNAYTCRAITPRSLVLIISNSDDNGEILQAAKSTKKRGAIAWAITANPASELAGVADAVVNSYAAGPSAEGAQSVFCRHAVMLFLAAAAARILKSPAPALAVQEEELGKMAEHVEWVLTRISDAAGVLARELARLPWLYVVGGGPFHPVALQAALRMRTTAGIGAGGYELTDFQTAFHQVSPREAGILYLSSSRCRLKEQVHQSVRERRHRGNGKIFAVTDANDRQLSERADLAVLLPSVTEAAGALLSLAFLELVIACAQQDSAGGTAPSPQAGRGVKPGAGA